MSLLFLSLPLTGSETDARISKHGRVMGSEPLLVKVGGGLPGPLEDDGHPSIQSLETQPLRQPP